MASKETFLTGGKQNGKGAKQEQELRGVGKPPKPNDGGPRDNPTQGQEKKA